MEGMRPGEIVPAQLAWARSKGIDPPVVALLSAAAPRARSFYTSVAGKPMPPGVTEDQGGAVHASVADTARLLREHAGPGGAALADALEAELGLVDHWLLALLPDGLILRSYGQGQVLMEMKCGYDEVSRSLRSPSQVMNDPGPGMLPVRTAEGATVNVYGRSGEAAIMAATLTAIAASRKMQMPHEGRVVEVPLNDDGLARMLVNVYGDSPHTVAEAITALRKMGPKKDRWLLRVLWGRPELRALAQAVQAELTGESTPNGA